MPSPQPEFSYPSDYPEPETPSPNLPCLGSPSVSAAAISQHGHHYIDIRPAAQFQRAAENTDRMGGPLSSDTEMARSLHPRTLRP